MTPLWGRPATRWRAWRALGATQGLLRGLRYGVRARWARGPPPAFHLGASLSGLAPDEAAWWAAELPRLLGMGVLIEVPRSAAKHVSKVFLVPKPTPGTFRMVVDLRHLNGFSEPGTAEVEHLGLLAGTLRPGDYMSSLDMQDGYYHFRLHPQDQQYFQFEVAGRYYQLQALNMGWVLSPGVFTDFLRIPVQELRSKGIRLLWYLDDFLVLGQTVEQCAAARDAVVALLDRLGLRIKPGKGVWTPTTRLDHLGMTIDSVAGEFQVSPDKALKLEKMARALQAKAHRNARRVGKRELAAFVGLAQFLSRAVRRTRFHLRELYNVMGSLQGWTGRVRLTRQALQDLRWWTTLSTSRPLPGGPIWRPATTLLMTTDSSDYGWGGTITVEGQPREARGLWSPTERLLHITMKELMAITRVVQTHRESLRGHRVRLLCDNQAVVAVVNNSASKSPALMQALRELYRETDQLELDFQVEYIRSEDNVRADQLSRVLDHNDWALNQEVFELLDATSHTVHTVDRFASALNAKTQRFNSWYPCPGAEAVDAFSVGDQEWRQELNWCNPPWGLLPQLATKLFQSGAAATVIAPLWAHTAWYQRLHELASEAFLLPRWPELFEPGRPVRHVRAPRWGTVAFKIPQRRPHSATGSGSHLPLQPLGGPGQHRGAATACKPRGRALPGRVASRLLGGPSWVTARPRLFSYERSPAGSPPTPTRLTARRSTSFASSAPRP